jgi:hypothetical protein
MTEILARVTRLRGMEVDLATGLVVMVVIACAPLE